MHAILLLLIIDETYIDIFISLFFQFEELLNGQCLHLLLEVDEGTFRGMGFVLSSVEENKDRQTLALRLESQMKQDHCAG